MPLISVHYEGPSPEVSEAIARGRPVRPDTPVALFRHGEAQLFVRARHVSPFVDLDARTITGTLWPLFLDATCAHVRLAPRISDAPAELDLAARFTPASGGPDTLTSVAEADRLLLHEVMGLGYHASWRQRARWSERLDIHLDDPEPLALQLVAQGCYGAYEWSPDRPALRSLYGRLSLATRLRCAATTAALREPFLSHLCDALSAPHTTRIHRRGDVTLTAHRLDEDLEVWSSRQHIIDVVGNPARLTTSRRVWQSRRHLGWTITPADPPPTDLRAQLEAGGPWRHEVAPADIEEDAWQAAAAIPHGSLPVGDVVDDLQDAVLDSASRAVRQLASLIDQGDLMLRRATSLRTHAQDALAGELERAVDGLRHDLQHHEAWGWLAGSGPSHPDPASLWASVPSAPAAALPDLHIEVGEDAMTQVATGEAPPWTERRLAERLHQPHVFEAFAGVCEDLQIFEDTASDGPFTVSLTLTVNQEEPEAMVMAAGSQVALPDDAPVAWFDDGTAVFVRRHADHWLAMAMAPAGRVEALDADESWYQHEDAMFVAKTQASRLTLRSLEQELTLVVRTPTS